MVKLKSMGIIATCLTYQGLIKMKQNIKDVGFALIVALVLTVLALEYFDILTK